VSGGVALAAAEGAPRGRAMAAVVSSFILAYIATD